MAFCISNFFLHQHLYLMYSISYYCIEDLYNDIFPLWSSSLRTQVRLVNSLCVYKILKYWPRGMIGICYWVAAVLSFVELVLQCLVMSGLVNYVTLGVDANSVANFFVYTQWPVFIVSSILSSLPIRHKNDSDNG